MLREASGIKRVIVACGRTDLRRGIDGLAAIIRLAYGLDPLLGSGIKGQPESDLGGQYASEIKGQR